MEYIYLNFILDAVKIFYKLIKKKTKKSNTKLWYQYHDIWSVELRIKHL